MSAQLLEDLKFRENLYEVYECEHIYSQNCCIADGLTRRAVSLLSLQGFYLLFSVFEVLKKGVLI